MIYKPLHCQGCIQVPGLVCHKSEVTLGCVDRVGYGEPAPGAARGGELAWKLTGIWRPGPQSPPTQVINCKHSLSHKDTNTLHSLIMPYNRWISPRYLDWVSNKRDTEPKQCASHDMTCLSCACTALALCCLLVCGLVHLEVGFHLTKGSTRSTPLGGILEPRLSGIGQSELKSKNKGVVVGQCSRNGPDLLCHLEAEPCALP
jgi:hypothetical protein